MTDTLAVVTFDIPAAVQQYINIVENEEYPVCEEQRQLIKLVKRVLTTEDVHFDTEQLEKCLSYEKYFPYKLFPWERFLFALHNCLYRADGELRFPEAFVCMGRGGGKTGYSAFENFALLLPPCKVKNYDIYTFAMSEQQAKTAWEDVYNILESNPAKFKKFFKWTKEQITGLQMQSTWYYCTSSAKTIWIICPGSFSHGVTALLYSSDARLITVSLSRYSSRYRRSPQYSYRFFFPFTESFAAISSRYGTIPSSGRRMPYSPERMRRVF